MKLTETFNSLLQIGEVQTDPHFRDRMYERFSSRSVFPLMLKTKNMGPGDYQKVGNYFMDADEAKKITDNIFEVLQWKMPKDERYGVVFHTFDVFNKEKAIYPKPDIRLQVLNEVVRNDGRLYVTDRTSSKENQGTVGDVVFGVLVNNVLETLYFNRSQTMSAQKHNLKAIVKSYEIASLANYVKDR